MTYAERCVLNLCKWLGSHREPFCGGCTSIRNFQNEERDRAAKIAIKVCRDLTVPGGNRIAKEIRKS